MVELAQSMPKTTSYYHDSLHYNKARAEAVAKIVASRVHANRLAGAAYNPLQPGPHRDWVTRILRAGMSGLDSIGSHNEGTCT